MAQQKTTIAEQISYDPDTGDFRWLISFGPHVKQGEVAGSIDNGYRRIGIGGYLYPAGKLAFYLMTGEWPENDVDHINGIRDDNRWSNLREATRAENLANRPRYKNNTSGFKGVWYFKARNKFQAYINKNGVRRSLGMYLTAEDAARAYDLAALELHGEFANINFGGECASK